MNIMSRVSTSCFQQNKNRFVHNLLLHMHVNLNLISTRALHIRQPVVNQNLTYTIL